MKILPSSIFSAKKNFYNLIDEPYYIKVRMIENNINLTNNMSSLMKIYKGPFTARTCSYGDPMSTYHFENEIDSQHFSCPIGWVRFFPRPYFSLTVVLNCLPLPCHHFHRLHKNTWQYWTCLINFFVCLKTQFKFSWTIKPQHSKILIDNHVTLQVE